MLNFIVGIAAIAGFASADCGADSYCKCWLNPPVCLGSDVPCTCGSTPSGHSTSSPGGKCDAYCRSLNGDESYCKYWNSPPLCLGGNQPCDCGTTAAPTTTVLPTTTTRKPCSVADEECKTMSGNIASYCKYWQDPSVCEFSDIACDCIPDRARELADASCPTGDAFCASIHSGSYCKYYNTGVSGFCQDTEIPCTCTDCPGGDSSCIQEYGTSSYCKSWQNPSVCQETDTPCSCGTFTTSGPVTTGGDCGDAKCKRLNGDMSYCKTWLDAAICYQGDQPCGC